MSFVGAAAIRSAQCLKPRTEQPPRRERAQLITALIIYYLISDIARELYRDEDRREYHNTGLLRRRPADSSFDRFHESRSFRLGRINIVKLNGVIKIIVSTIT